MKEAKKEGQLSPDSGEYRRVDAYLKKMERDNEREGRDRLSKPIDGLANGIEKSMSDFNSHSNPGMFFSLNPSDIVRPHPQKAATAFCINGRRVSREEFLADAKGFA